MTVRAAQRHSRLKGEEMLLPPGATGEKLVQCAERLGVVGLREAFRDQQGDVFGQRALGLAQLQTVRAFEVNVFTIEDADQTKRHPSRATRASGRAAERAGDDGQIIAHGAQALAVVKQFLGDHLSCRH